MGYFLAVSAFRGKPVGEVADAIIATMTEHGVSCRPSSAPMREQTDTAIYDASPFTIVLWPEYFNVHDIDLCALLTVRLRCAALTSHTYDGDYWTIALCREGAVLDRFCSHPGYFAQSRAERESLAKSWKGDAEALGHEFGADPAVIARYLVHQDLSPPPAGSRAWPDDKSELSDLWVFTDLWRKLGANYPEDLDTDALRLRVSDEASKNLPGTSDL